MQSFPLSFGKVGQTYQIDKVIGGDSAKHMQEIGFVHGSKVEILSNQKKGMIVKVLNANIAIDFITASHVYIHEMVNEDIQEM